MLSASYQSRLFNPTMTKLKLPKNGVDPLMKS